MTRKPQQDRFRDTILEQLERVEAGGRARVVDVPPDLSAAERRRLTEYVSGIVRWRRYLDFLIDAFLRSSTNIEVRLRHILRIGVYELVILHRPVHVVVDASVEQAKRILRKGAGGFANGVLRAMSRSLDELPEPETGDLVSDLAVRHSHPDWMVRRWLDRFGRAETVRFLEGNNRRPIYGIRVNTLRIEPDDFKRRLDSLEVEWEGSRFLHEYVRVRGLQPLGDLLNEGLCAVQDESSGLIGRVLDPEPGEYLIDACAAPGGKSLHAAIQMRDRGRIEAVDLDSSRLRLLDDAAARHGIDSVRSFAGDFLKFRPPRPPDRILIDAPCSGLGVLAGRADLRWQRGEEAIGEMTRLQDELLAHAADLLPEGGILVYSTCTIEPEENANRVAAFLEAHADFTEEPLEEHIPHELLSAAGRLATYPHRHGIDGVFAARMRKN